MTSFIQQAHETVHFDYYTKIARLTYTSYISKDKMQSKMTSELFNEAWLCSFMKPLLGIHKVLTLPPRTTIITTICLMKLTSVYCQAWLIVMNKTEILITVVRR